MLDLNELGETGEVLEMLTRRILIEKGLQIDFSGKGPDDGKDVLAIETVAGPLAAFSRTWLVQCKNKNTSQRSVGPNDCRDIPGRMAQHRADAYLLVTTTEVSSGLKNQIDAYRNNGMVIEIWDREVLTSMLSRTDSVAVCRVLQQYFRQFFKREVGDARLAEMLRDDGSPQTVEPRGLPGDMHPFHGPPTELARLVREQNFEEALAFLESTTWSYDGVSRVLVQLEEELGLSKQTLFVKWLQYCASNFNDLSYRASLLMVLVHEVTTRPWELLPAFQAVGSSQALEALAQLISNSTMFREAIQDALLMCHGGPMQVEDYDYESAWPVAITSRSVGHFGFTVDVLVTAHCTVGAGGPFQMQADGSASVNLLEGQFQVTFIHFPAFETRCRLVESDFAGSPDTRYE